MAYAAAKGSKLLVVVDGKEGPEYVHVGRETLIFSPDGKRLAYETWNGDKRVVVVDGKPGPEYDWIGQGTLVFSPDSKRFAYVARKGYENSRDVVVLDGREGPEYDQIIWEPIFSPDGKRVAYIAEKGDKSVLVVDGREGPEFDSVHFYTPFPFDLADLTVERKPEEGWNWVKAVGHWDHGWIAMGGPVFSPRGQHVAYAARKDGKCFVVLDGRAGPKYDQVWGGPSFHPDGRLEYLASRKGILYRVRHVPGGR